MKLENTAKQENKMKRQEPQVELLHYNPSALELLLYTKSTRLDQSVTLGDIMDWSMDKKMEEFSYMKDTIQTSMEFSTYIFKISNVSRAFTHQLVRTRDASFQQETMRAIDVRDHGFLVSCSDPIYEQSLNDSVESYGQLVDKGYPVQDCRGILPMAIQTKIFFQANLRTLSRMAELRLCKRTEGEYQDVFKMVIREVVKVHPWARPMLQVYCAKTGFCAFPRYTKCPVQRFTIRVHKETKEDIRMAWERTTHVANPKAKDGKTM